MAPQENTQVLRSLYEAVNQHDIDRAVDCFQNDGEFKTIAYSRDGGMGHC